MSIRSARHFKQAWAIHSGSTFEPLEFRRLLSVSSDGVSIVDGQLVFDPDGAVSRALTPVEAQWLKDNPGFGGTATEAVTPPPTGPIDPVAEYEPMEGLVISWLSFGGSTASPGILAQITRRVTVEGQGRVYIGVTSATVQSSATSILTAAGADLNRVTFFTVPLNSVWARDYGPRYVYEGDVRVITDHKYNRSTRTSDDNQPVVFSQFRKHQYYDMGLGSTQVVHGGGNYHLNGSGDAYATQLIVNENTPPFNPGTLTEAQIKSIYSSYQNNNLTITAPFPTSVDATQHIDMWMQIYDDDKVFISDWPNNVGSAQDVICDNTAALMQSRGYTVTRIPAYSIGGTHYTYANMVIMNDIVLLPQYNNGPGAAISNQVLATVQAAYTPLGKTVYQINGDGIVTLAGVFHCIVQHVPQHLGLAGVNGGLAPTAYLREIASNTVYSTGQQISVSWISDDDAPVAASGGGAGCRYRFQCRWRGDFPHHDRHQPASQWQLYLEHPRGHSDHAGTHQGCGARRLEQHRVRRQWNRSGDRYGGAFDYRRVFFLRDRAARGRASIGSRHARRCNVDQHNHRGSADRRRGDDYAEWCDNFHPQSQRAALRRQLAVDQLRQPDRPRRQQHVGHISAELFCARRRCDARPQCKPQRLHHVGCKLRRDGPGFQRRQFQLRRRSGSERFYDPRVAVR
ncbi:MAG TPA: agmatine deiminase family protein [Tepidisphaeraceae bacterium]|nr:agmatine deiminase family protein [Tepidisphaeraceae bacterium]